MIDISRFTKPTPSGVRFNSSLNENVQVFICTGYTDLRKSIDGLSDIVSAYGLEPSSGNLFAFCGKRADRLKILFYDEGMSNVLVSRLENKRMKWPRKGQEIWRISRAQWMLILNGDEITRDKALKIYSMPG